MAFTRLRYHVTFATRCREPHITPEVEERIHGAIEEACEVQGGVILTIGGVEDHVHLLVTIPPSIAVQEFVKELKRHSSRRITKLCPDLDDFSWQVSYAAFTATPGRLGGLFDYIEGQKKHHGRD